MANITGIKNQANIKETFINYNLRHLIKGDPIPPWNGKLRVYNLRYCPYAHRILLTLIAKKVDFEIVNVSLMNKPDWLKSKSPFGRIPSLEVSENECIAESLIACEYIDEKYPQRPMLPKDLFRKAIDKVIAEMAQPMHTLYFKAITKGEITEDSMNSFKISLEYIENELKKRGSTFLHGNEPGYADYMTWPWFERLPLATEFNSKLIIDEKEFPLLTQYIKNMENDQAVKEYNIPADIHKQFIKGYLTGNVDYELLNK